MEANKMGTGEQSVTRLGDAALQGIMEPESLPDIALQRTDVVGRLDRVGMTGVEIMVRCDGPDGQTVLVPALADAFVSLDDPHAKGIHMSRLLLALQENLEAECYTPALARRVLDQFIESHAGLSRSAQLRLTFTHLCQRPALLSDYRGWRHYPVTIDQLLDGNTVRTWMEVSITYSSTCPCSAALSRQVIQQQFIGDFSEQRSLSVHQVTDWLNRHGSIATPHSQRSVAKVTVELAPGLEGFPVTRLVDVLESAVSTAVQTVVKRADEQEFARVNGSNLMFCEDAARMIKSALDQVPEIADYRVEASHFESLHPHNAVAIVVKGVPGGLRPEIV
jgi:GTP cyclohydrolase I